LSETLERSRRGLNEISFIRRSCGANLHGVAVKARSPAQFVHDTDVRELKRLETVWNEAHEHGDGETLEALWADDMEVAVPRMPVLTKDDALKFARSGRMKFLRYQTSDIRVRVYDNAAVVTGRL
jgi:hypothetical protein